MGQNNQSYWKKDEDATSCDKCRSPFSFFNRRHHCRRCGFIFCGKCTSGRMPVPDRQFPQPVRVCDACSSDLRERRAAGNAKPSDADRNGGDDKDRKRQNGEGSTKSAGEAAQDLQVAKWKQVVLVAASKFICIGDSDTVGDGPMHHACAPDVMTAPVSAMSTATDATSRQVVVPEGHNTNTVDSLFRPVGVPEDVKDIMVRLGAASSMKVALDA
eukprot:PhF_6_TR35745/c0_g1_i1/m.51911